MNTTGAPAAARLYTTQILALATELADYPLAERFHHQASVRSRSCGSTLEIGLSLNDAGKIDNLGLKVSACAIGQASAAIFARWVFGRSPTEIEATSTAMQGWLANEVKPLGWSGFTQLNEARGYPGRHDAIMLPWRGAMAALSKVSQSG